MRHSEANHVTDSDFDRALTEYGKELAKNNSLKLELFLEGKNISLDCCFYSSAQRTSETYEVVKNTLDISNIKTHKTRALYLTGIKELKEIFRSYKSEIRNKKNIMIIAHNFGISDIATILSKKFFDMNPAEIVILEIDDDKDWYELLEYEGSWKNLG